MSVRNSKRERDRGEYYLFESKNKIVMETLIYPQGGAARLVATVFKSRLLFSNCNRVESYDYNEINWW